MAVLGTVLLVCCAQARGADAYSGVELLADCTNAARSLDGEKLDGAQYVGAARCAGFVPGFFQGYVVATMAAHASHPLFCDPSPPPTGSTLIHVVARFARNHPDLLSHNAGAIVGAAFVAAFPCKK